MRGVRPIVSLGAGVVAALGLFLLMNSLIGAGQTELIDLEDITIVDFVRVNQTTQVQTKDRQRPKEPEPAKPRPPSPRVAVSKTSKPQSRSISVVKPQITVPVTTGTGPYLGGFRSNQLLTEGDVIPILRIAPEYPRAARMKGTEGWVTIRFTINEDGTVSDPTVVEAQPKRVFEREAMRAIKRWQFKPRIVDGVAIKRSATQTIEFEMAD